MSNQPEQKLITLLENTTDSYEILLEVLKEKQDVLLERDVDRLEEITEKERVLVDELQQLEEDRNQLWDDLLDDGTDREEIPLNELLEHVSDGVADNVREIRVELKRAVRDVRRINQENMLLLENRISVYDEIFNMITGEGDKNKTYGPDSEAETHSSGSARLVDEAI